MNVISWESGDSTITDLPACADLFLARVVQGVNDRYCTHRDGDFLCPECSVKVLELAHRTVGTNIGDGVEVRRVWVRIAAEEAERALALFEAKFPDDDRPRRAVEAAFAWVENPSERNADAAYAAIYAAYYAADAARAAARAYAAATSAYYAADAAYAAIYAATSAAAARAYAAATSAKAADDDRLSQAHRIIDRFLQLTGITPTPVDPVVTAEAVRKMTVNA